MPERYDTPMNKGDEDDEHSGICAAFLSRTNTACDDVSQDRPGATPRAGQDFCSHLVGTAAAARHAAQRAVVAA